MDDTCYYIALEWHCQIGKYRGRYGEPVYGIHVLWNRLTVHGYRKLSAKGNTEPYDRDPGYMDIAG